MSLEDPFFVVREYVYFIYPCFLAPCCFLSLNLRLTHFSSLRFMRLEPMIYCLTTNYSFVKV